MINPKIEFLFVKMGALAEKKKTTGGRLTFPERAIRASSVLASKNLPPAKSPQLTRSSKKVNAIGLSTIIQTVKISEI